MTKKKRLINYINKSLDGFHFLHFEEIVINSPEESMIFTGDQGMKTLGVSNARALDIIQTQFNDDLVGKYFETDKITVEIVIWDLIDRPIEYYE